MNHSISRALLVSLAAFVFGCSGSGGGGPAPPQNQPPDLSLSVMIELNRPTEVRIRITGSATDPDGTVIRIECRGEFSGTFGSSINEVRTVPKMEGRTQTFGTSCTATDDDGATDSASDAVQIGAIEVQPPSLSLSVSLEAETDQSVTIRITGSASDSDGTVQGIECQGDFSGTFGSSFNETRTVNKIQGQQQSFGTTCVATDDDGATTSRSDSVLIAAAPLTFSGRGNLATDLFTLRGGFVVFTSEHSGNSNFIVWVRNAQGELVELVANEIGDYSGTRGFSIDAGQHLLDIDADGAWTITIEEPQPTSGTPAPLTVTDTGDNVIGPLQLSAGLATFDYQHTGDSNFIVWLYRADGERIDLVANEIGNTSGSTATNIPTNGLYFLDVHADGSWEIGIQ